MDEKGCSSRNTRQQFVLQMSEGGSHRPGPAAASTGLWLWGSRHAAAASPRSPRRLSPAEFLASGQRICINLDGLMWGDHQLDFPCGSESQLGLRGLPLAAQPGARWRVMACGGSGADVPHCARTQKRAGMDVFFLIPPFCFHFPSVLSPSQLIPAALFIYLFRFVVVKAAKLLTVFSMRMLLPCALQIS